MSDPCWWCPFAGCHTCKLNQDPGPVHADTFPLGGDIWGGAGRPLSKPEPLSNVR